MALTHLLCRPARPDRPLALSLSNGFTLIELLVVTGIIVVVSTIVLADNNRFGGVVQLENLAYNVALSVRQAQAYGISVARFQTNIFTAGYGVHFDLSSPNTYVLFADAIQVNGLYDCPQPGTNNCELVQTTSISKGYGIYSLCITPSSGVESCSISKLDIVFKRPEPDAGISASGTSCILNNGSCGESARIVLKSPRGDKMSVIIYVNGQISVQKAP